MRTATLLLILAVAAVATGPITKAQQPPAGTPATRPAAAPTTAPVRLAPSDAEIKDMVSRAAGMPGEVFLRMITSGRQLGPADFPNHYLTADLLFLRFTPSNKGTPSTAPAPGFRTKSGGAPKPAALADALIGGNKPKAQITYASVVWPAYITELKTEPSKDQITGWAAFEVADLYAGQVNFTLSKVGGGWKVTRIAVGEVVLRLAEDGTWEPAGK